MDNLFDFDSDDEAPPESSKPGCECSSCVPHSAMMRMVICPTCGNKRCPHATHHDQSCSGSNEPGQWGSSYGVRVPGETDPTQSLVWAANQGDLELARRLLAQGSPVDARCSWGMTPLLHAANHGHAEMMELLLAHGADPHAVDSLIDESALLVLLAQHFEFKDMAPAGVEALLSAGVDPNALLSSQRQPTPRPPLHLAALAGDRASIKVLLKRGAQIEDTGEQGSRALLLAARAGRLQAVEALLAAGADPLARDEQGMDALAQARSHLPQSMQGPVVDALLKALARIEQSELGACSATAPAPIPSAPRI